MFFLSFLQLLPIKNKQYSINYNTEFNDLCMYIYNPITKLINILLLWIILKKDKIAYVN